MGREFASAAARWCHLLDPPARPELVAVCNRSSAPFEWFRRHFPGVRQYTADYRELLANPEVEAVYVAVPHHLHREVYCAAITAGKHLLGEKPFGMDRPANAAILAALRQHGAVFARCASEFPFYPAVQQIAAMIEQDAFGRIIELNTGFLHSSDLDPGKPINWKRQQAFNGEYGVLGDLGMHVLHLPLRAGWRPCGVRAVLSKIVTERPDASGRQVACDTWDNGTLLIEGRDERTGERFPWTMRLQRIAPGQRNTWYLELLGTRASVRWSSANPRLLERLRYSPGGPQIWEQIQTGYEPAFPTITGAIFEFGFTDAILQMWAAFVYELVEGRPLKRFAGLPTPEETALSHALFTAALESQRTAQVVSVAG